MTTPPTDINAEPSIDRNLVDGNVHNSKPNINTSTGILNTTMSYDDDGSVVVDLTKNDEMRNGQRIQTIVDENGIIAMQNKNDTKGSSSYPPKRTRNQRWLPVVLGMAMLLCFACGIYFFLHSKQKTRLTSSTSSENTTPITVEELSLHSDKINDCWILINDTVYNVTQYAPTHPGGSEYVTDFCGSNSTKDYYINHPYEYLEIHLSSDSRMGVISSNNTTTAMTDDSASNKNNFTTSTDDRIDDTGDDDNTSSTPTLVPTLVTEPSSAPTEIDEPSSIPSSVPSSVPTVFIEPSMVPTVANTTTSSTNITGGAPTSKPISAVSAPTSNTNTTISRPIATTSKPITPTRKPIAPTLKPIAPTRKPITPTRKPTVPTMKPIAPTPVPTIPPVPSCISADEVALHNSETDCYYILYDFVYDFTNYVNLHPGGARKVFQECGTDATSVYITEKKHDESLLLEVNALELYGLGYAC